MKINIYDQLKSWLTMSL